jgi:hypothetical protein
VKRFIGQLQRTTTTTKSLLLLFGLPLFIFLMLAFAQWGSGSSCGWQFPKWFGCVLHDHESLAAGLIGAAGALFAAWIAWTAVQLQLEEQQRQARIVESAYISGGGARKFTPSKRAKEAGSTSTYLRDTSNSTSVIMGRRQGAFLSSAGASAKKLKFQIGSHRMKQSISIAGSIRVDPAFRCWKLRYQKISPGRQSMGVCSTIRSSEITSPPDSYIGSQIHPVVASL